nr:MAG TPA: hypothetical protein [Caudoviricetes sp.]
MSDSCLFSHSASALRCRGFFVWQLPACLCGLLNR